MRKGPQGFSLLELVIVLMIAFVLLSVMTQRIGKARSVLAAQSARHTFLSLHARTRAQAIEFGVTVRLMVDIEGDSAWIAQGAGTIETYRFAPEGVDLQSDSPDGIVELCIVARGYSEPRCNSMTQPISLAFVTTEASDSVFLTPLGRVTW